MRFIKCFDFNQAECLLSGVWIPAIDPSSKVPVAIKVLREGSMASRNLESLDEAFYMASMDHPCLVRLLAVCLTQQMMLITQVESFSFIENFKSVVMIELFFQTVANFTNFPPPVIS